MQGSCQHDTENEKNYFTLSFGCHWRGPFFLCTYSNTSKGITEMKKPATSTLVWMALIAAAVVYASNNVDMIEDYIG